MYDLIDGFQKGVDVEALSEQVRQIYRQFGQELRDKNIPADRYAQLRELTRQMRDQLEAAFHSQDIHEIQRLVAEVLKDADRPEFQGTSAQKLFPLARQFLQAAQQIDLRKHQEYAAALQEVEGILFHSESLPGLLGPRPGEPPAPLTMLRYGATRWDQAQALLDRFLWVEQWIQEKPGARWSGSKPRADLFPESLRPLFAYVAQNADKMLLPRRTIYWQFLIDDNVNSHYFGGIGPEILGTILITVVGMLFVVPLGIISAAYLVELCFGRLDDADHPHGHQHAGRGAQHRLWPIRPGVLRAVPLSPPGLCAQTVHPGGLDDAGRVDAPRDDPGQRGGHPLRARLV